MCFRRPFSKKRRGNTLEGGSSRAVFSERPLWGPVSSLFIFDTQHTVCQAFCSVLMFRCFVLMWRPVLELRFSVCGVSRCFMFSYRYFRFLGFWYLAWLFSSELSSFLKFTTLALLLFIKSRDTKAMHSLLPWSSRNSASPRPSRLGFHFSTPRASLRILSRPSITYRRG